MFVLRLRSAVVILACALAVAIGPSKRAAAQITDPHVTMSPYAGAINWDDKVNVNGRPAYGGRVGFMMNEYFGIEASVNRSNSDTRDGLTPWVIPGAPAGRDQDVSTTRSQVSLIANLVPHLKLSPFLVGGWSRVHFDNKRDDVKDEWDRGFDLGAGVLVRLLPRVNVRIEGRDFGFRFHARNPYNDELTHNIIYTVGVQYSLGGHKWVPAAPAAGQTVVMQSDGDSDRDGVSDSRDLCPNTPPDTEVDANGCPDSDGDGVPDNRDRCPDTQRGCRVDADGCPIDGDGDGVCDGLDQCPNTPPNTRVDREGCPTEVGSYERDILETGKIVLRDVHFDTGKADLRPESRRVLDEVGRTLIQLPDLQIEIGGHCDWRGSTASNKALSGRRANAVLNYLLGNFPEISRDQWTAVGYGEDVPVASNDTDTGMALNRRVEFRVLNGEVLDRARERRNIPRRRGDR